MIKAVVCVLCLIGCASAALAQQFDPAYRFQVLTTDHFRIYFHQGEQPLAVRLAPIAEDIWHRLTPTLGPRTPERTEVVIIDQTDAANGWATPIPRNIIAIYAAWPAGSDSLKTDDWLRLVFSHEFTHIVHLDRSQGWARVVRSIFGRTPYAFPNLFLPGWQIEGLAVYEESELTGDGRVHAGDFRAIVGEAARAKSLLPLDRVNGGLTRWPGGGAQYAYGTDFHAYLADRYGPDSLRALADRTAGYPPYLGSRAFAAVYSKSLGTLWREFEAAQIASAAEPPSAPGTRLTRHDYEVIGPRFVGREVYYSLRNADEWPSLYRLSTDAPGSAPERVMTRMLGSTIGAGQARIYFDQQELRRNAGLYSDLYSLEQASGTVTRLTHGQRLMDPDLSPDGRSIVAVQMRAGRRALVLVSLISPDEAGEIRTLVSATDRQFNAPRWSPDGRTIAVESQALGSFPQILLVNPATGESRVLASGAQTRWVTPAWRRDGAAIIAAAAIGDEPFNLFEIGIADGRMRQLTRATGGATWPEMSPDGSAIVYVGRSATGLDLYQMSYDGPRSSVPGPASVPGSSVPELRTTDSAPRLAVPGPRTQDLGLPETYSPWPTLAPTSWSPLFDGSSDYFGVGAETAGSDVLGYHRYAASFLQWLAIDSRAPSRAPITDWSVSYAYTRWQASAFVSASQDSIFRREPGKNGGDEIRVTEQDMDFEAGVALPILRVRTHHVALASFLRGTRRMQTAEEDRTANRAAVRFGWSFRSAAAFGNSISLERGLVAGATAEIVRASLGSDADATTMTGDVRAYLPGAAPHHVLALRAAAGRTSGDRSVGRRFLVGGGGANASVLDFGSEAMSLMRGFASGSFAGTRLAMVNADYRWPLRRIERGRGTWPIFLHTVHASLFADVAQVWTSAVSAGDLKTAVGGEISANVVFGYFAPMTVTAGVGRGHDGSGRLPDRTTWYARVGYAF